MPVEDGVQDGSQVTIVDTEIVEYVPANTDIWDGYKPDDITVSC